MAVSTQSRSPFAGAGHALADINITPLVDVMLVLLVIFMVTAPLVTRTLDSRVPIPGPRPDQVVDRIELVAQGAGLFRLDGRIMSSGELDTALAARIANARMVGEVPVLTVGASGDADYQSFAEALAAARASGIGEIALAP